LNDAGHPLFSRYIGLPNATYSFPVMGLLSATHSSITASLDGSIATITTHDAYIQFAERRGGLIIIFVQDQAAAVNIQDKQTTQPIITPQHTTKQIQTLHTHSTVHDRIYDALTFLLGKSKLQDLRHAERAKKHIRVSAAR
jgi:hypothetical protein